MRWRDWLALTRLPLAVTAPGDAVGGFLLAGGRSWVPCLWAVGAVTCLYVAGMVLNDLFDLERDRRLHPERPLVRGALPPRAALRAGLAFLAAGVTAAYLAGPRAGRWALLLACFVLAYDGGGKHLPYLGNLLMGGARGTSVLLGGAAASWPLPPPVWFAAGVAVLYIAALTSLSLLEDRPAVGALAIRWRLGAALLAALAAPLLVPGRPGAAGLCVLFLAGYLLAGLRRRSVPALVGRGVRGILFLQAAWILGSVP